MLACSAESFVLDNDMIGSVLRATRGIEVNEDSLSLKVIQDVCLNGPGHFLGHDQTLDRMQDDYFYPQLADRRTPQEWAESGSPDLLQQARAKTREILAGPRPTHITAETDALIRSEFPIRLSAN